MWVVGLRENPQQLRSVVADYCILYFNPLKGRDVIWLHFAI